MSEKYVQLEIWDLLEEAKLEPFEVSSDVLWQGVPLFLKYLGKPWYLGGLLIKISY